MKPYDLAPSANRSFAMNGSSTSIGPSTTSTNMLAKSSVHSSHGVRSMKMKPSRRSRSTCGALDPVLRQAFSSPAWSPPAAPARRRTTTATVTAPSAGNVAPTTIPATAGPTARWNTGRTTPSTPLAASSCSAGRILGRIALYAGKKNAAATPMAAEATARCQTRSAPARPSTAIADDAITLTDSVAMMIVRWLIRSAVMPPTRTNATKAAPQQVVTIDNDTGSLSSSMT